MKMIVSSSAIFATVFAAPAFADEIKILVGDIPTMIMNDGTGREADVIKATLEHCGHSVSFQVQPFTRHWQSYKRGAADAVATIPVGMPISGTQTKAYIHYQNGVSTLTSAGIDVKSLVDLKGKKVIAFKGATEILPGMKEASSYFSEYREVSTQIIQSRLLFAKRTDAVISDGMIFAAYNRELRNSKDKLSFDPEQPVIFKATFDKTSFAMAFRNKKHAADFDRCFVELTNDGTIDKINKSWADKYRDVIGSQYLGY